MDENDQVGIKIAYLRHNMVCICIQTQETKNGKLFYLLYNLKRKTTGAGPDSLNYSYTWINDGNIVLYEK